MVEIFSLNIYSQTVIEKYDYYLNFANTEKRERLAHYKFEEDKRRSLYGEVIIRKLITERLKIDNSNIIFSYNAFGKPYLANSAGFHFNISHSGEWVICGIGSLELGIDIEQIKSNNDDIAKRFFSTSEYENLMKQNEEDRLIYFYDLWTLKESYIKCIGKGLQIPLNSFSFEIQNEKVSLYPSDNSYNFRRYDCFPGYRVAVCTEENRISDVIKPFEI